MATDNRSSPISAHDVAPMRAVLADGVPHDDQNWAYEIKWDGMRVVAEVDASGDGHGASLHLSSAAGNDATDRFPELAPLAAALAPHHVVLDGEIVALDHHGHPDFGRLQPRMQARTPQAITAAAEQQPVIYVLFDLLAFDGNDVTPLSYENRHRLLTQLVETGPTWLVTESWTGGGADLLDDMRAQGMEGLIAKRLGSRYEQGRRSSSWLKVKVRSRQELVVGGWSPGRGNRAGSFGSLLVGYHPLHSAASDQPPEFIYAGKVGAGFSQGEQERLRHELDQLSTDTNPFTEGLPGTVERDARWVRPELVIEVAFAEWTAAGVLRHPAYLGQRFDKEPAAVVLEVAHHVR